jgi:type IV secretory pathway VirB3-like protein
MDNTMPVHKSLIRSDLVLGVPRSVLMLCLLAGIIFWSVFGGWYCLLALVIYIPCYAITRVDPDLILITMDCLFEPDFLEG